MDINPLKQNFPDIKKNELLSQHSSFRIGGPARFFYKLTEIEKLPDIITLAKKCRVPYFVFGGGSNILFPDKGLNGLVIKIAANNLEINNEKIEADAGVLMSQIECFGSLRTIPGTIGGAIRGNAGTMGLEIADIIEKVLVYDPKTGKTKTLRRNQLKMGYRTSRFKETAEIILKGFFHVSGDMGLFEKGLEFRRERQPFGLSGGSFFKNPLPRQGGGGLPCPATRRPLSAGELIEKAGLRGQRIGGAQISEKHANFILNLGNATSKDILKLASLAKTEVKKKFGINLEEEVILPDASAFSKFCQ